MAIPTYTPEYPPDGSSLGQTKATVRNNLDGTFYTLAVDHVNNNGQPGSNPAGYHTIVHEVPQTSVTTVTGYNQLFSGVPGTLVANSVTTPAIPAGGDTQLYSLSGLGALSQLTGYYVSGNFGQNGYVWCAGILLQWGVVTSPGASGTVLFATNNVNFPHNCFNVSLTLRRDGSTTNQSVFLNGAPTSTSFGYTGTSSGSQELFWFAVGN